MTALAEWKNARRGHWQDNFRDGDIRIQQAFVEPAHRSLKR
jgi:hypothetical protein